MLILKTKQVMHKWIKTYYNEKIFSSKFNLWYIHNSQFIGNANRILLLKVW